MSTCYPLVLAAAMAGCGGSGNIAKVSGTVTLDGQPLADAMVTFIPKAGGSPSAGRTDTSGAYVLVYTRHVNGAEIGDHTVKISTYSSGDATADPPKPAAPEKVPEEYNAKTELTATVKRGSNTLDFSL